MPTQEQLDKAKKLSAAFIRRCVSKPWAANQEELSPPIVYAPNGEDRWRMFTTGKVPNIVGLTPNGGVTPSSQKRIDSEGVEYDQVLLKGNYRFFHLNRTAHAHLGSSEIEFGESLPDYYWQSYETGVSFQDPDSAVVTNTPTPPSGWPFPVVGRDLVDHETYHTVKITIEVRWGGTNYPNGESEAFVWYESLDSAGGMDLVWLPDRLMVAGNPKTLLWRIRCREQDLGPGEFWSWNEFAMLDLNWIAGYILREMGTGEDISDGLKVINATQEFLKSKHDLYEQTFSLLRREFFKDAEFALETWWPITPEMFLENDLWPDTIRAASEANIFAWNPHISRAAGEGNRRRYAHLGFPWSVNSKTQAAAAALVAYGDGKPWWADPDTGTGIEICRRFLVECFEGRDSFTIQNNIAAGRIDLLSPAFDSANRVWRQAPIACPQSSPWYSDWVVRVIEVGCMYWQYCKFIGNQEGMDWVGPRIDYWMDKLLALQFDWNGRTRGDGHGDIRDYYSPWCAGGMPGRFRLDDNGDPYVAQENTWCNQLIDGILALSTGPDEQHVDQWYLTEHPEASLEWYHALLLYEQTIFQSRSQLVG